MNEPVWLRQDVALAVHRCLIAEHGGQEGVRDPGLLESALARARNRFMYAESAADLAELAACNAYAIASNHPFVDGNIRTALVLCRTFLRVNHWDIEASQQEKYLTFMRLARGDLSEEQLAGWIRAHLVTLAPNGPSR